MCVQKCESLCFNCPLWSWGEESGSLMPTGKEDLLWSTLVVSACGGGAAVGVQAHV